MLLVICAAIFFMSGCLASPIEDLYSLPKPSEEYLELQKLLDVQTDAGSEYASPLSGSYRQSVQLYDLNGDGSNEAIAFFRGADEVLRIFIYKNTADGYVLASTIKGEGAAINSIEYADLNGDGNTEFIVEWRIGIGINLLKVYSFSGSNNSALLTADCSGFIIWDINNDGSLELLVLSFSSDTGGILDMYKLGTDMEMSSESDRLSMGVTSVESMRAGYLSDGVPAVFVEGAYGQSGLITDVFAFLNNNFANITLDENGVSNTLRDYNILCTDIDEDHALEVPVSMALYSQEGSSSTYWVFDWYDLDSAGNRTLVMSTYHSISDGWYFIIPKAFRANLTVRREDSIGGERAVILSTFSLVDGSIRDFLEIYTLTGENRFDRAVLGSRFVLQNQETTTYAARITAKFLKQDDIKSNFRLIYTEWTTDTL